MLKGPQGTLFGRNATGGVIQITTREPTATPHLDAEIGYANYNTASGSLYAAGPLTPVRSRRSGHPGNDPRGWLGPQRGQR